MENVNLIGLYNASLFAHQMRVLNYTPESLADETETSTFSVNSLLAGTLGTLKLLRRYADALHINWDFVTQNLPESQFHRAVIRTANSKAAR